MTTHFFPVQDRPGVWKFLVTQIITDSELTPIDYESNVITVINAGESLNGETQNPMTQYAVLRPDIRRVEIKLPNGRILRLKPDYKTWEFSALWRPEDFLSGPFDIKVVTFDRALNTGEVIITINPLK